VDFRRRSQKTARDCSRQLPIKLGCSVGHSGLALNVNGQQRMRRSASGPGVFIRAEKPDSIGGETGRFGGPGDLNGRVARLGSEECFIRSTAQLRKKNLPADAAAIKAQRAAVLNSQLPALKCLVLGA